jgi:hypothetical protein
MDFNTSQIVMSHIHLKSNTNFFNSLGELPHSELVLRIMYTYREVQFLHLEVAVLCFIMFY